MIETWRQCCTSALYTPTVAVPYFMAIGPFRAGGHIRELRFALWAPRAMYVDVSAVVSPTENATEAQFRAGAPVIQRSNRQGVAGQSSWHVRPYAYATSEFVVPLSRRVDSGAQHLLMGLVGSEAYEIGLLATVTVIGFARIGANGLGVEDGLER